MRILIVSATALEVAALQAMLGTAHVDQTLEPHPGRRLTHHRLGSNDIDVLVTGVGMVATAAWCSRLLAGTSYDLALNVGVCGSFDGSLRPGVVVHVVADRLAELGAEDGEAFIPVEELPLPGDYEFVNASPPGNAALAALPAVRGITVNTVHGNQRTIAAVVQRFSPQIETMEGAAFMYACLIHGVAFAQVRAVSNVVERRNRAAWKMAEAIDHLCATTRSILEHT